MPNSSRFAADGNLTFGVMGGKSGKKRQGGWQKRQGSRQGWQTLPPLPPQLLGGKGPCGEASYRLGKGLPDWEGITMWLLRCHPRQEREKRMFLMRVYH